MGFHEFIYEILAPTLKFVFFASFVLLFAAAGFFAVTSRSRWMPAVRDSINNTYDAVTSIRLPGRDYLYSQLPSSFAGDMEAGLTSSTFDLSENVDGGDSRAGLDDTAKREILKIMKKRRMKFDQARRVYMEQRFAANGIGADGRPRDPKFVSFS